MCFFEEHFATSVPFTDEGAFGVEITEVWINAPKRDGWSTLAWTFMPEEFLTNLTIVNTDFYTFPNVLPPFLFTVFIV